MHIKIDIAGVVDVSEYDKDAVMVGCGSGCDIILEYEGIAGRHLLISQNDEYYRVTQLPSEFKTYIDGRELDVGSSATLRPSSQIEIGGIFLSIDDENQNQNQNQKEKDQFHFEIDSKLKFDDQDKSQSIEDLLSDVNRTSPNLEALEKLGSNNQADDSYFNEVIPEKSAGTGTDYRPNLSPDTEKIQKNLEADKTKKIKKKIKTRTSVQQNRKKLSGKRSAEKRQGVLYFIFFLTIAGCSYFFFSEEIKKRFSLLTETKVQEKKIRIAKDIDLKFLKHKNYLEAFTDNKSCLGAKLEAICVDLEQLGLTRIGFKVVEQAGHLVIGLNVENLKSEVDKLLPRKTVPDQKLKFIIQKEYREYFSFADFKANGYKPTLKSYIYAKEENKELIYLLSLLFKKKLQGAANFKRIFVFGYLDFMGDIVPEDFLDINPIAYDRELEFSMIKMFKLNLAWNYSLTAKFSQIVSSFADSKEYKYNASLAFEEAKQRRNSLMAELLDDDKCADATALGFCNDIKKRRTFDDKEGIVKQDSRLFVYLDLGEIDKYFTQKKYPEYTNKDRQYMLQLISDESHKRKKEFQSNNYFNSFVDFDYDAELIISDFIENELAARLLALEGIQKIQVIAYRREEQERQIVKIIDLPINELAKYQERNKANTIAYLVKSKISIFKEFLKNESILSFDHE